MFSIAPTALALTTSLLSTGLPRIECKRHVALFSLSTPTGALATYLLLTFFGTGSTGHWPGIALLVSVSSPVCPHRRAFERMSLH